MAYEKMKGWAFRRKKRQYMKAGMDWTPDADRLVRTMIPGSLWCSPREYFTVEHSVHGHVGNVETRSTSIDISLSGGTIETTSMLIAWHVF